MIVAFHTYPRAWPWPKGWRRLWRSRVKYGAGMALRRCLTAEGIATVRGKRDTPRDADLVVMWSWKQPRIIEHMRALDRPILVLERGFLPSRRDWVTLAVDGFNGRGQFAPAGDGGERWERYFSHLLKPWKTDEQGYALVIGQVPGDAALHGADIVAWAQETTDELVSQGHRVVYRPHPSLPTPCPAGAELSTGSLEGDLAGASRAVIYNSTTAVESILAGVPTVISDMGSVAYPMASHSITAPLVRPDRTGWCHDLAWRQWTLEELADGSAWNHVRPILAERLIDLNRPCRQ